MAPKSQNFFIFLQFRIVLPLVLLAAAFLRFNAISMVYLLCLLVTPLLRKPSRLCMQGPTGIFLNMMVVLSVLPVLGNIIFHVTLVALATDSDPYGSMFTNCSSSEQLVRQIGFQRLDNASIANILRLVVPDVLVLLTSVVTFMMAKRVSRSHRSANAILQVPLLGIKHHPSKKPLMRVIMDILQNFLFMACGVMVPSILGVVYFLVFLCVLTLWGCYKSMGRLFGFVRIVLLCYCGSHILLLYLYQFQFFQDALDPADLVARVLGLTEIVYTDCSDVDSIKIHPVRWSAFVNVGLLLTLYWVMANNVHIWKQRWQAMRTSYRESVCSQPSDTEHGQQRQMQNLETGSMVFSGSFNELDDQGEEELLMEESDHQVISSQRLPSNDNQAEGAMANPVRESEVDSVREDRDNTDQEAKTQPSEAQEVVEPEMMKRKPWMSVVVLIMRQSYVLSLIAMMAWSITYHSWLTFVLLLTACILWMMSNSRQACLKTSPFVLIYAELLLLANYIYNMNLEEELPTEAGEYELSEIGLKRFLDPCLHLALQVFYTLFLALTMRQYLNEARSHPVEDPDGIRLQPAKSRITFLDKLIPKDLQKTTYDSKTMVFIGHFIWILLCKYWIIFCCVMMAVISLQEVVIYKIIYMFLILIFLLIFQLNYRVWRAINYAFWWLVIIYSMVVLIIIYTFQFEEFNDYWTSKIGISDSLLHDIGLIKYDTAGLFMNLLTPTCFLVFVILQVRYFHQPFLKLSDPARFKCRNDGRSLSSVDDARTHASCITEDEEPESVPTESTQAETKRGPSSWRNMAKAKILAASCLWEQITNILWRLGEIHIFKLMTLIIMITAVKEVCALTCVYLLVLVIFLPIIKMKLALSSLAMLWTIIIILAKMIYQLSLVKSHFWVINCTEIMGNGTGNVTNEDDAIWIGLEKLGDINESISKYLEMYLVVLTLICVESIVRYRQRQYYAMPSVTKPQRGILFDDVSRAEADDSILSAIKFFANYFFYKFGLECCWVMTAITASVRLDAVALIYIIMMGILMVCSRRTVARIWPFYTLILVIFLVVQFLFVLGFPKGACITYPWMDNDEITTNLKQWLFLPDYTENLHARLLIADFLQLLLVCMQAVVFDIESKPEAMINFGGGDNRDIVEDVEANKPIPCADFTIHQKKNIEVIQFLVFEHMFWVTMAIIFVTGTTRINIFSLFYVIAVFCFMWFGKEFFLKPLRSLLSMWNMLIGYCVFVLFAKTALQLVGCVYVDNLIENGQCWLVQLFGVNCLSSVSQPIDLSGQCPVEEDDSGMSWDVVCLVFLLLQRRIYSSHYFRHVVDTMKAQNSLVSKGAELINRIMIREVNKQNEMEKQVLVNIKEQMKALKKKQASRKKDFKEAEEHFQAIRAGDYYLFEDEEQTQVSKPSISAQKQPTTLDFGAEHRDSEGQNVFQLINTAQDQNMEAAVSSYDKSQQAAVKNAQEKDDDMDVEELDNEAEDTDAASTSKLVVFCNFVATIWYSIIDGLIRTLNKLSRNYRLVAKKLSADLIQEKRKVVISRLQSNQPSVASLGHGDMSTIPMRSDMDDDSPATKDFICLDDLEREDDEEMAAQFASNKDRASRLLMAIGLLMASQSELLCYLLMILDQMVYGSLLSLPLPLMVFLWGMLSVPRPSKTFWVTVITYIEAIVVCKYLFQFGFFPWNDDAIHDSPFYPPRIIGIEKKSYYANMDIILLLVLFVHRSILRKYGLWRDSADISADLETAQVFEKRGVPLEMSSSMELDNDQEQEPEKEEPPTKMRQGLSFVLGPFTKFFKQVTGSSYNATTDVYAPMFFCDFILFLVLVFGFSSFGPAATTGDGDVATYIQDNKIPVPFLIMLLTQFIFIVIDRGLFLRKNVLGKFIFQIIMVITIHLWMFFLLPAITERSFFDNVAAQIWYFIKSIYFGLSAYQIRCGYPTRILGNFLTKSYGIVNMALFKGFLAIPFLLELRALMDWMWTDSTLALGNWLQLEDIYANIYVLKCWREFEKTYPQQRSLKKNPLVKYLAGGALLIVIIFIIWFPLVFFSFFNAVFISNPPQQGTLTIGIGGYQPMFSTTALGDSIRPLTDAEFNTLKTFYSRDRNAYSLISGYDAADVTLVQFDGDSLAIWGINPPSQVSLANDLRNDQATTPFYMTVDLTLEREPDKAVPGSLSALFEIDLRQTEYYDVRHKFADVIEKISNETVQVDELYPRFLRLASTATALPLDELNDNIGYSNITMKLETMGSGLNEWWNINELLYDGSVFNLKGTGNQEPYPKASFITFNDKKAPESLSFLSGYGIIGLYISFVIVIGRLLRVLITNQYQTIMFRELPDVDRVLQILLDLYLVREMKEWHLEEDFYAMILFLYRSPETLIKMTRQTIRIGNIKKKKED